MGDQFKLDGDGICPKCNLQSVGGEHIQCISCNNYFHVICGSSSADEKVATKTTINNYNNPSTKNNFVFFCDRCLTEMEIGKSESDTRRIDLLEGKMTGMDQKLAEIMALLKAPSTNRAVEPARQAPTPEPKENPWFDVDRLAEVKVSKPKAVLVINNSSDHGKNVETQEVVEKVIVDNAVSLKNSHKNKDGDLVLVCESEAVRDELKNLVEEADESIDMKSPSVKLHSITIVGLQRAYEKEEVINKLIIQNDFLMKFVVKNDIYEHLKIHVIKPLWNKQTVFQAVASVSSVLRDGLRNNKDKVVVGLTSCKIYDKKQVKRCYNCQDYGHLAKACPTASVPSCGKCGGNHRTDHCESEERNCANCRKHGMLDTNHSVFYYNCPILLKHHEEQEKNKRLNSSGRKTELTT